MGSSQAKPESLAECNAVDFTNSIGTTTVSSINDGHWLRGKSWLPGAYCYDGTICAKKDDHIRSLDGWKVTYGGPGTCAQGGWSVNTDGVALDTKQGQWHDWHY